MTKKKNVEKPKAEPVGRPQFDGRKKEVIQKLEEAWALGCSDLEACCLADIAQSALYAYQKNNPKFLERKERLKNKPFLKARKAVIQGFDKDHKHALEFLKATKKGEFGGNNSPPVTVIVAKQREAIESKLKEIIDVEYKEHN